MDAAVLYRAGIAVRVPQPARLAVHKLILAQKRGGDTSKRAKDLKQADAVISALRASDLFAFRDVGFVQPGQDVEVKVEAFTFTRYGLLHGTVDSVSRDAVVSDARLDRAGGQRARGRDGAPGPPAGLCGPHLCARGWP